MTGPSAPSKDDRAIVRSSVRLRTNKSYDGYNQGGLDCTMNELKKKYLGC